MGVTDVTGNDPYNMEEVAMPLEDYINDPIAMEIIHNGATFQVFIFMVYFPMPWALVHHLLVFCIEAPFCQYIAEYNFDM